MASFDLLLRNGSVVTEAGVGTADVAVADGTIVAVEPELAATAREEVDATRDWMLAHLMPYLQRGRPARSGRSVSKPE